MASVGNVRIGSRNIDIQAFTGQVTSRADRFLLSNGNGHHAIEVSTDAIGMSSGQKVTGFWGVVRGADSDWLALFNHDTGKWAWFTRTRNRLAGPPLNRLLVVVAVFAAVAGVVALFGSPAPGVALIAVSALVVWRVRRRRKALMHAVGTALTAVQMEA
jgi:hypothetical protein